MYLQADTAAGPMAVPAAMSGFALQRHLGSVAGGGEGGGLTVKGSCGWAGKELFKSPGGVHGVAAEVTRNMNGELVAVVEGEVDAARAFDQFGKALLALGFNNGLTLPVMSIQPVTTSVRGLGATLLSPHPLCWRDPTAAPGGADSAGKRKRSGGKGEERVALSVAAIDCVVTLQESGKWPDDVEAIGKLSAALYLTMANSLNGDKKDDPEATIDLKFVAKAFPDHLQVLGLGYAFRVRIWNQRQVRTLQQLKRKSEGEALELARFHRPQHTQVIFALVHKFPSMGETLRLCKRWAALHLLSAPPASSDGKSVGGDGLSEEALELLVAHCYTCALPFSAPASPLAGYVRFLWLLAATDWDVSALIVDLSVASVDGSALSPQV